MTGGHPAKRKHVEGRPDARGPDAIAGEREPLGAASATAAPAERSCASAALALRAASRGAVAPHVLLALQRAAGNRAVTGLVVARQDQDGAPQTHGADNEPVAVALYLPRQLEVSGAQEFGRQAQVWARNHDAIGLDSEGNARRGLAMAIDNGRPQETLRRVLDEVHRSRDLAESERVPLATLAVFTHGSRRKLQMGMAREDGDERELWFGLERLRPLFDIVADAIVAHGDVVFYACSAAGPAQPVGAERYRNLVQEAYDYLADRREDVEVWGHTSAAHTTGNPDTASSSGAGRELLYRELAERSFAARSRALLPAAYQPDPGDSLFEQEAIATLASIWREALTPRGHRAALYALIEELPLLGYDAFYRVITGIDSPSVALSTFSSYGRNDRELFAEAVEIVRSRFNDAAADVAVSTALAALGRPVRTSPPPVAGQSPPDGPARRETPRNIGTLTPGQVERALAFYRRKAYSSSLLLALRQRVGAADGPEPVDEALVHAVARYQASQTPPLTPDGMAGPATLRRLGLDGPSVETPEAPARGEYRGSRRPRPGETLSGHTFVPIAGRIGIVIEAREFRYASYGGHHGFQYAGKDVSNAFATAIEGLARRYEQSADPGDRYRAHAARSMRLPIRHEGKASAINTYDSKILTIGAGFAGGRLNAWLQSLAGTTAGDALAAMPYLHGLRFDGREQIRLDINALNQIAAAIEDPANAAAVAEAQVEEYIRASALDPRRGRDPQHLRLLDNFATSELTSEPHADAVLGVATYLRHGMPGFTPDPALDTRQAMRQHPGDTWAQVADICRRHVERMWRQHRDGVAGSAGVRGGPLPARTVTARIPNKLALVADEIGEPINGTQMSAVAPCMTGRELTPAQGDRPPDPDGHVFLMHADRWYDFGPASARRERTR